MLKINEDALICDLAETYNILNYRSLPARLVATLSVGLRANSRIKLILSEQKTDEKTLLLASIVDRLSLLLWSKTRDCEKGRNKPSMIVDILLDKVKEKEIKAFYTPNDFDEEYKRLSEGG